MLENKFKYNVQYISYTKTSKEAYDSTRREVCIIEHSQWILYTRETT
jgi:hypothetical protein